jgi:hypothetical protein
MKCYQLSHLADHVLLRDLATLVAKDRGLTADLLAHLAEVDARKLYLPAAYPSLYLYCVHELHLCEQAAFKRILAARTARRFPAIFAAVADGRLHLSAVVLLAPHLTEETVDELLAAAAHKSKSEIERLLAARFPRPELPTRIEALGPPRGPASLSELSPGIVQRSALGVVDPPVPGRVEAPAEPLAAPPAARPVDMGTPDRRTKLSPLAPQRFALQVTIGQSTHDKLRYVQALLGHAVPSGELPAVLDRALDALIEKLERRKFAACSRSGPRRQQQAPAGRYIPADVRRTVWERDGGQCTFVSTAGQRCPARTRLEFDHILEVARGGQATVAGLRLRCRGHNLYQAERTFGTEFMRRKRHDARH